MAISLTNVISYDAANSGLILTKSKVNTEGEDNMKLCSHINVFGMIAFVDLFTFYKYSHFLIVTTIRGTGKW